MTVYIDTCCYCRPFDNRAHMAQQLVRQEVYAIIDTIRLCGTSGIPVFGSAAINAEMDYISDYEKRERVRDFYYEVIAEELMLTDNIALRAQELAARGIIGIDSYHIAFGEAAGVNFLLTTDSRFEKAAGRLKLNLIVMNPINFLGEYFLWRLLLT